MQQSLLPGLVLEVRLPLLWQVWDPQPGALQVAEQACRLSATLNVALLLVALLPLQQLLLGQGLHLVLCCCAAPAVPWRLLWLMKAAC